MNGVKFQLYLQDEEKIYMKLKVSQFESQQVKYINKVEFCKLQGLKNKIFNSHNWDKHKKFSNDYELIHIPNKRNRTDSVALYQPLSRSYFKMIELLKIHNILTAYKEKPINSFHLAEGPGGFIEAMVHLRKNKQDNTQNTQQHK